LDKWERRRYARSTIPQQLPQPSSTPTPLLPAAAAAATATAAVPPLIHSCIARSGDRDALSGAHSLHPGCLIGAGISRAARRDGSAGRGRGGGQSEQQSPGFPSRRPRHRDPGMGRPEPWRWVCVFCSAFALVLCTHDERSSFSLFAQVDRGCIDWDTPIHASGAATMKGGQTLVFFRPMRYVPST